MNGMMNRALAHATAVAAVAHWQATFDARKAAWIETTAAETYKPGLFKKRREIGRALAEKCFVAGWSFGDDGHPERAFSGHYWPEFEKLCIAQRVARLTDNGEQMSIILTTEELAALHPVMKPAVVYRCKRCGQSDAEASAAGCSMSPCPMEPAQ